MCVQVIYPCCTSCGNAKTQNQTKSEGKVVNTGGLIIDVKTNHHRIKAITKLCRLSLCLVVVFMWYVTVVFGIGGDRSGIIIIKFACTVDGWSELGQFHGGYFVSWTTHIGTRATTKTWMKAKSRSSLNSLWFQCALRHAETTQPMSVMRHTPVLVSCSTGETIVPRVFLDLIDRLMVGEKNRRQCVSSPPDSSSP